MPKIILIRIIKMKTLREGPYKHILFLLDRNITFTFISSNMQYEYMIWAHNPSISSNMEPHAQDLN